MGDIPLNFSIDTSRLRLRAVSEEDVPFVWSATRYTGFNDGMRWDPPIDPAELIEITQCNLAAWQEGLVYAFTIESRRTGKPVGRLAIRLEDTPHVWYVG